MTLDEAKQSLATKLDINYSDIANNELYTDSELTEWILAGILRAWDFKRWDFAEGSKKLTITAEMITDGYIDYPTDFQMGTINLIRIAGKEWSKKRYQDLVKHLEDYPTSDKKYWAEYKRFIFFNTNILAANDTADFYGKLKAPHLSASGDLLPFSEDTDNEEYSGNQAIVKLAYGEALGSEKLNNPAKSKKEKDEAFEILALLWKPFEENLAMEQSMRPAFNVGDFYASGGRNSGGNKNIGNFDY